MSASTTTTTFGMCLLTAALGGALFGCDSGRPPVTPPPDATPPGTGAAATPDPQPPSTGTAAPTPTPTTAEPAPTAASLPELRWAGTWSSPSCGSRTYERRLMMKDDMTFRAEDRVSPCPPKVQCVWAGIVFWQGTWSVERKGAMLTKTGGGQGGPGGAAKIESPLHLEVDRATSGPVEVQGSERCVYTRAAEGPTTAPPGKSPSTPPSPASQ